LRFPHLQRAWIYATGKLILILLGGINQFDSLGHGRSSEKYKRLLADFDGICHLTGQGYLARPQSANWHFNRMVLEFEIVRIAMSKMLLRDFAA